MKNHWDKNLKVKNMVMQYKPNLIVELGGGGGDNTDQYLELQKTQPFKLITISDGESPPQYKNIPLEKFEWRFALSYKELPKFDDDSIDFCSIDTDHNYWTLKQELMWLSKKMKKGGIVVIHDTESYRHNSGLMMGYTSGDPYPEGIIKNRDRGMGDALNEAIENKEYEIIKHCVESCGATAIKKL